MKNNTIRYSRMLETVGTLVLAILLSSFFIGCAAKQANPEATSQVLSAEQANPETTPQVLPAEQANSKAKMESIQQAVKNSLDSTVRLVLKDAEGKSLEIGSGFFVQPGLIVTNLHVVEGADSGYARLVGEEMEYSIKSITRHEEYGLALLKVTTHNVKPLPLEAVQYRYGIPIYALGDGSESQNMFSKGIVTYRSVDNRTILVATGAVHVSGNKVIQGPYKYMGNTEWFGLTTQISRGSSGAPVLNSEGKVIGVSAHRGGISGETGNFAISSKTLVSLLQLKKMLEAVK